MGCPSLRFSGRLSQQPPALFIEFELQPHRDRQAAADLITFPENQASCLKAKDFLNSVARGGFD